MAMPFFRAGDDPGASFPELLKRMGLATVTESGTDLSAALAVPHATTCVALRYADGVVMAGDRRATSGNLISHRGMEKVVQADLHSGVAIAGAAGPAAPAMATPLCSSACTTFSMPRWLMRLPLVARRSPAITTPSA